MYDLGQKLYSHDEVFQLMTNNRKVSYRFDLLDKDEMPLGQVSASGSISYDSDARIKRAARLDIKEIKDIDFINNRIRPYMLLDTPRGALQFPLGVFLLSSPSRSKRDGYIVRSVECYDKLQILSDDKFTNRYFIAAGTKYTDAVIAILASAGIYVHNVVESSVVLQKDIEYPTGTAKLDAVNSLLKAINYTEIYVNSLGQFMAIPYIPLELRSADASYCTNKNSIVKSGASQELDLFNVPNRFVRYLEDADRLITLRSVADNVDPLSPLSIQNRGRVIVDAAAVSDIPDQYTLDAYTQRLLNEATLQEKLIFESANIPNHEHMDCIFVTNSELGITGKYVETGWNMKLSVGGSMQHILKRSLINGLR